MAWTPGLPHRPGVPSAEPSRPSAQLRGSRERRSSTVARGMSRTEGTSGPVAVVHLRRAQDSDDERPDPKEVEAKEQRRQLAEDSSDQCQLSRRLETFRASSIRRQAACSRVARSGHRARFQGWDVSVAAQNNAQYYN